MREPFGEGTLAMLKFVGRLLLFNLLFYATIAILVAGDRYRSAPGTGYPAVAFFLYSAFIWFNIVYLTFDGIGIATGILRSATTAVNILFPVVSYLAIVLCVMVIWVATG